MPKYDKKSGAYRLAIAYLAAASSTICVIGIVLLFRKLEILITYHEYYKIIIILVLGIMSYFTMNLYAINFYSGKGLMAKKGKEVLDKSKEIILYLRSFTFDDSQGQDKSWENIIVGILKINGPVIAIGNPDDEIAPIGATRFYVEEDASWQDKVAELIKRAKMIVIVMGNTEGLLWEINKSISLISPERLIIFCPSFQNRELLFKNFAENINKTLPNGFVDYKQIENNYFVSFEKDWAPIVLKSKGLLFFINWINEKILDSNNDKVKCLSELNTAIERIRGRKNWTLFFMQVPNFLQTLFYSFMYIVFLILLITIYFYGCE